MEDEVSRMVWLRGQLPKNRKGFFFLGTKCHRLALMDHSGL